MSHQGFEPTSHHLNWGTERAPHGSTPPPEERGGNRFLIYAGMTVASLALLAVTFSPILSEMSAMTKSRKFKSPESSVGLEVRCFDSFDPFRRGLSVRLNESDLSATEGSILTLFHRIDGVYSRPIRIIRETRGFYQVSQTDRGEQMGHMMAGQVYFTQHSYAADMVLYSGKVEAKDIEGVSPLASGSVNSQFCLK